MYTVYFVMLIGVPNKQSLFHKLNPCEIKVKIFKITFIFIYCLFEHRKNKLL